MIYNRLFDKGIIITHVGEKKQLEVTPKSKDRIALYNNSGLLIYSGAFVNFTRFFGDYDSSANTINAFNIRPFLKEVNYYSSSSYEAAIEFNSSEKRFDFFVRPSLDLSQAASVYAKSLAELVCNCIAKKINLSAVSSNLKFQEVNVEGKSLAFVISNKSTTFTFDLIDLNTREPVDVMDPLFQTALNVLDFLSVL